MLSRLNTASFEFISHQYDHEVQGNSVIKPLQGPGRINGSATVIRPLLDSPRGGVLSQGLYPSYSDIDAYRMAACSIDTAVRNALAVGAQLDHLAILDNFCWCDSNNPERLAQLKDAARACYDTAVAYGTPFISGKDSMFNDFRGYDENFNEVAISIPPPLLISSIGVVDSIARCQTMDFKCAGDLIYVLGETGDELGGSEYYADRGERLAGRAFAGGDAPCVDTATFMRTYRVVEKAMSQGLAASCVSIERGGLALAAAKSSMAGLKGAMIDLSALPGAAGLRSDAALFSESQGRLLVSVAPERAGEFEGLCSGIAWARVGQVTGDDRFAITGAHGQTLVDSAVPAMMSRHKGTFSTY
jgi:phosphoribosylformylglycinamidine synthase